MTDKEKKSKIADILLEFYEEYQCNMINRPMIPSIYASKIIDSLQEELVSEDLENELDSYIKANFTIDKEQLDRFGIKEKDYMYSMDKSDIKKMVRYFTDNYKIPLNNDLEEVAKLYVSDYLCITGEEDWDDIAVDALNIFKAGAKWGKNQAMAEIQAQSMALAHECPKEETVSEELKGAANNALESIIDQYDILDVGGCLEMFKLGAKWQEKQDQKTIELAEDHAMLAGMEKMKEQMMAKTTDVEVKVDAGGYPYIPQMELYDYDNDVPFAKEGDKYKVILIKEE